MPNQTGKRKREDVQNDIRALKKKKMQEAKRALRAREEECRRQGKRAFMMDLAIYAMQPNNRFKRVKLVRPKDEDGKLLKCCFFHSKFRWSHDNYGEGNCYYCRKCENTISCGYYVGGYGFGLGAKIEEFRKKKHDVCSTKCKECVHRVFQEYEEDSDDESDSDDL